MSKCKFSKERSSQVEGMDNYSVCTKSFNLACICAGTHEDKLDCPEWNI